MAVMDFKNSGQTWNEYKCDYRRSSCIQLLNTFHLFPVSHYLGGTGVKYKLWKGLTNLLGNVQEGTSTFIAAEGRLLICV